MNIAKYTFSHLKLLISLFSFCFYVLCFYYARPIEPTHDAINRFSAASNVSLEYWYLLLLHEPFALIVGLISGSPYEFLLVYAFFASIVSSALLRVPLWVWGLFIFSPPGYLLTFNITPSLIAFSVVNFTLLARLNLPVVVFGLANHVVAFLAFSQTVRRLIWASFRTKLLALIFGTGMFFALGSFLQNKLLGYSGVSGNVYHSYFALCCLLVIFTSGLAGFRFVSLIYMAIILGSLLISVKMSSRIAFGADLLSLQFCFQLAKTSLAKNYPRRFNKQEFVGSTV